MALRPSASSSLRRKLDLAAMMKHKDATVAANVNGVAYLFKKNKIDWLSGEGRIAAPGRVIVKGADGNETAHETKAIVIATGSDFARLPGVEIDEKTIVSSTGALSLPAPPKKLIVVGAGVIGLELGSVWRRLGSEVTVVEFLDHVLTGIDGEAGKFMQRMLEKAGLSPFTSATSWPGSRRPERASRRRSSLRRAAKPRRSRPTSCSSLSDGARISRASGWRRLASRRSAGRSSSTRIS